MATTITKNPGPIVLVGEQNGITVIPSPTPLTRLNYFDGKFLRATDLQSEQRYLRSLVEHSNKAGGHGVAYGYDVSLAGSGLQIGQGLAIDPEGRVLLLPQPVALNIQELVQRSRTTSGSGLAQSRALPGAFGDCIVATAAPPAEVLESGDLYVITIAHAEALCGEEDVYGKLCEEACVTSTDRPYRLEGVVVRARPLQLLTPLPASAAVPLNQSHLRSRVASAYFATERLRIAQHISKAGLESGMWCFGAQADSGREVPIGVFGLAGSAVLFLDAWIARRERIDAPAKRYWQWRMRMRPWDVFLAQVLQFQCQLHDLFSTTPPEGGADDPCAEARSLVAEAAGKFDEVTRFYATVSSRLAALNVATLPGGLSALTAFNERLAVAGQVLALPASDRRLIRGGIIELPAAGYLPVVPGSALTVNGQVRQLLGEGVDLRFCVVRPDFVAHALEEAQHMDRISLTQGLDDPSNTPRVDILVPNGEIVRQEQRIPGAGWEAAIQFAPGGQSTDNPPAAALTMRGAARTASLDSGGAAAYAAGAAHADDVGKLSDLAAALGRVGDVRDTAHFETLRKFSEEASAASADPDLFANLNRLAAESAKFAATGKASQRKFTAGVSTAPGRFRPASDAPPVAAVWVSASCARDPFGMQVGELTPVDLQLAIVMPTAGQTSFSNSQWRGDFRVDQPPSTSAGVRRVSGTATLLISSDTAQTGEGSPSLQSLRFNATLTHDTVARTFEIRLVTSPANLTLRFVSEWQGDPLKARTRILYRIVLGDQAREIVILDSLLTRNDEVLKAANPAHTASLSATQVIGAALGDPGFADAAARLLFPPPPPSTDELLVRATADWVLFHRRRDKICGEEKVAVAAAVRRYQVYHLLASSLESAEKIRQALLANDAAVIAKLGFRPVDAVEFAAGVQSLNTPVSVIQSDWQTAAPGNRLLYGAVASSGVAAGEGDALALARLSRLQDAVAPISAPHAQIHSETLEAVPAPLAVPGSDGVMVLVTIQAETKTTCHAVFRTTDPMTRVLSIIQTEGVPGALERGIISSLGNVQFNEGTSEAVGNGLEKAKELWNTLGNGTVGGSVAVFALGDDSVTAALRAAQAQVIQAAIGQAAPPQTVQNPIALGVDCTTVTIILATTLQPGPFTFEAQAAAQPVRSEGTAEPVGDYVLAGTGGSAGQEVTANIQYSLNTAISNTATSPPVLLINDPPAGSQVDGVNRFTAVRPAGQLNSVLFSGVKLALPGSGKLTLRVANVRANVAAMGTGTAAPPPVIANLSISGTTPLPVNNPQQVVGKPTSQVVTEPRTGRIFVLEGSGADTAVLGPRRVTTVNFAPDGSVSTSFTDEMLVEIQRMAPYAAMELATQEAAPDPLAKTRAEAALKDLQSRNLTAPNVSLAIRALNDADRRLLPGTISSANDIVLLRRG
ncbi:MAG: hypothetical protein IH602_19695 [Bryobacteraceae bacterium]|nr:hypothetical protein [Bryobacteraceae bacterium]